MATRKNCLIVMVLLSGHNICFIWELIMIFGNNLWKYCSGHRLEIVMNLFNMIKVRYTTMQF